MSSKASGPESDTAKLLLLQRIQRSSEWLDTRTLCESLERHTAWGRHGTSPSRRRTVQNWLKRFRETHLPNQQIEARHVGEGNGVWEYRRGSRAAVETVEEACLALLGARLLDGVLPFDYLEGGLEARFRKSKEQLAAYERQLGSQGDAIRRYLQGVAVVSRGQRLASSGDTASRNTTLAVMQATRAILQRYCVEGTYAGRRRILHPYGLIVRDPKIYLLAIDDKRMVNVLSGPDRLRPQTYLCSRFSRLAVNTRANRVPDDFEVNRFIAEGGLEIPLTLPPAEPRNGDPATGGRAEPLRTRVIFRVFRVDSDKLIQDLTDHPLSEDQIIDPELSGKTGPSGETTVLVTIPDVLISRSLVDWLVGRLDRVEVLEPLCLREYLVSRFQAMLGRYAA